MAHAHTHTVAEPPPVDPVRESHRARRVGHVQAAPERLVLDYARLMFRRQHVMLPPAGFTVDWADQPSRHKLYETVTRVPLPEPFRGLRDAPLPDAVQHAVTGAETTGHSARLTLSVLTDLLAVNALTGRQTALDWNDDSRTKLDSAQTSWSRPTASGGGMYPVESYVVVGGSGPLPAGVYHYDTAHHALDVLSRSDRTGGLRRATHTAADVFLVGAVRFWKNSFKYNSFCYHVVMQDTGALLGSWRAVLGAHGLAVTPRLWFDQALAAEALGIDAATESPVVVVPLQGVVDLPPVEAAPTVGSSRLAITKPPSVREQSRRKRTFPLVEEVIAATHVASADRPMVVPDEAGGLSPLDPMGGMRPVLLDSVSEPGRDVPTSLLSRRSAFGTLVNRPGMTLSDLGAVLAATDTLTRGGTDLAPGVREPWVRLWVVSQSVQGLAAGIYAFDAAAHSLTPRGPADLSQLQSSYALHNYNAAQAGAMIVISGRLSSLVGAYGAAGYRFLSIEVGQAAQVIYLAAASRGLGVGAVLGVDNLAVNELLALGDDDEQSMLFLFLGGRRPEAARYDHRVPHRGHVPTSGESIP